MNYRVRARVLPGQERLLAERLAQRLLGRGEVFEAEINRALTAAVVAGDEVHWVESCYCDPPLKMERIVLDTYFDLLSVAPADDAPLPAGTPLPEFLSSDGAHNED